MTGGSIEEDREGNYYFRTDTDAVLTLFAVNNLGFAAKAEVEIKIE